MSTSRRTSRNPLATVVVALDSIIPYWRNPRRIPDDAVNALATSLDQYGYNQPIVVDKSNVIIIGHSRYAAMRRMGLKEVPVMVADLPAAKVKELRVLDNRTKEFTSWNFEDLSGELADMDKDLMRAFFPEVGAIADAGPETKADEPPDPSEWGVVEIDAEFVCPSCFHTWTMEVTKDAVKSGRLEVPNEVA